MNSRYIARTCRTNAPAFKVAVVTMASMFALPTPASAQTPTVPNDHAARPAPEMDDIVVTARRKAETQQTIPLSLTVVSPTTLASNNITTVRELQTIVPSLTITPGFNGGDTANFMIRGQGASGIGGNPAVAIYLNEVPLPFEYDGGLSGGPGLLFDLENVQVLKGPQGTLFGRNTMGGAILLQTAQPKNTFGARVQASYGNYNDREIEGAINVPIISDKLLARVAFNVQKRDGYTYVQSTPSAPNGARLNNRDTWGVRGSLSFQPDDIFRNDLTISYNQYKTNGFAEFFIGFDPANPFFNAATNNAILSVLAQQRALGARNHVPTSTDFNGNGGSLFAIQNISSVQISDYVKFRNIAGFSLATWDFAESELDGTIFPFLEIMQSTYRTRQLTEEAQFQGTSLGGKLDWVVGAFYLTQRPMRNQAAPNVDDYQLLSNKVFGSILPDLRGRSSLSQAVYAQATYALLDNLRVTAGIRYTWDNRREFHRDPATLAPLPDLVVKNEAPTWTLGIDWQATPSTLLYVTSRRGFRAGGSQTISTLQVPFGPEYVTDFEGGFKSDWTVGDVAVRTNGALFYQKYRDIQIPQTQVITFPDGSTNVGTITANAAGARLWGGEFEANAQLTPQLRLGANVSYLNFKYTEVQPGVDTPALIAAGRADRVPWTYGVNGRFSLPIPDDLGEVALQASYSWRDKAYDTAGINLLQSYGVVNASLNWTDISKSGVDASVFVSNLTNKDYIAGGTSFFGFNVGTYGEPRMYGVRLGYKFGSERR